MKVIKKGREQKGWAREFKCTGRGNDGGGCGAVLLVEFGDLFATTSCARDEVDRFVTFACSECGVLTDLTPSQEPPGSESLPTRNPTRGNRRVR